MSDKLPALQFYTGDWRKDPCVQALDHEHKGVWIDLLCILNETTERGRLVLPDGTPFPDDATARNLGLPEAKWKQIRSKLVALGVASEDDCGVLYNRRIVRDQATREARARAGQIGGRKSRPAKQEPSKMEAEGGSSVAVTASSSTALTEHAKGGKKRKSSLPSDWAPTESHMERALADGIDLGREVPKFKAYHTAKGSTMANWNAAFTTWLLNAKDFRPRRTTHDSEADDFVARERKIFEDRAARRDGQPREPTRLHIPIPERSA